MTRLFYFVVCVAALVFCLMAAKYGNTGYYVAAGILSVGVFAIIFGQLIYENVRYSH